MKNYLSRSQIRSVFTLAALFAFVCLSSNTLAQRVAVGHLAPFADNIQDTEVSVELDQEEVIESLVYNEFTDYLDLSELDLDEVTAVDVLAPAGDGSTATISGDFSFNSGIDYTVIAIGGANSQPLQLLQFEDTSVGFRGEEPQGAAIRVVHAAPFGPPAEARSGAAVSITFADGTVVGGLNNFQFGDVSPFLEVPAGTYDLQVRSTDGTQILIDPLPVDLADGEAVTLYAVGDGTNQPLGITAFFNDGPNAGTSASLPVRGTLPESNPVPTLGAIGLFLMMGLLALVAVRRLA